MSPHFFLFRICIWRDFKNKIDVCHVLCEELFMLDGTRNQADVETEFGVVSLTVTYLCKLAPMAKFKCAPFSII